jgi:hypothetical protein
MGTDFTTQQAKPRVSIIIPVFNGANYLARAIESALRQTYTNCEVIVINDGSIDSGKSEEIALSFGNQIRYFSKSNGGVASALNYGIAVMEGEFFSWLSHDDEYYPTKIAVQIDKANQFNESNPAIFYSDYELIDEHGSILQTQRWDTNLLKAKPFYALFRGYVHGCSVLVPSYVFDRFGTFDEHLRTTQDYDLWFRIIRQIPFIHIPEVLVRSRWHAGQDSKNNTRFLAENNQLWVRFVDALSSDEMIKYERSVPAYFGAMSKFLRSTPFDEAREHADLRLRESIEGILVSVIVPFYGRIQETLRALHSVQQQSHRNFELIVVDDGTVEDIAPIEALVASDPRCRLIRQGNLGPAAARNSGIKESSGAILAFLDSDDTWPVDKLHLQLIEMHREGYEFSHTSYIRCSIDDEETLVHSGQFSGLLYPRIIGGCPIAISTVMMKREVVDVIGFFEQESRIGEDIIYWIEIAKRFMILGIDETLCRINVNVESTLNDPKRMVSGLTNILSFVLGDRTHRNQESEIFRLIVDLAIWQSRTIATCDKRIKERIASNYIFMSMIRAIAPASVYKELLTHRSLSRPIVGRLIQHLASALNSSLRPYPRAHRVAQKLGKPILQYLRRSSSMK